METDKIVFGMFMVFLVASALGYFLWIVRIAAKSSEKAAEILRIYAERGEEPPQNVIDALTGLTGLGGAAPKAAPTSPTPKTRGRHFSDSASSFVFAIGAAGIAWWRAPQPGEDPGALMILAVVAALIFTASAVSHWVSALHTSDGQ